MKKGFFVSITYLAIGLLLTVISYFAFDNSYAHGPSFFHLVALLFFFGGCGWTLVAIWQLAFVGRPSRRVGIVLSNVVILSAIYLKVKDSVWLDFRKANE